MASRAMKRKRRIGRLGGKAGVGDLGWEIREKLDRGLADSS
jgi:hypothetical protein